MEGAGGCCLDPQQSCRPPSGVWALSEVRGEGSRGVPSALLYIIQGPLPPLWESEWGEHMGKQGEFRAKVAKEDPTLELGFVPGALL